jgi:hypothetical protein
MLLSISSTYLCRNTCKAPVAAALVIVALGAEVQQHTDAGGISSLLLRKILPLKRNYSFG